MACKEKQIKTEYDLDSLRAINIVSPSEETAKKCKYRWDNVAKPLDGLGDFEDIICKIGAIKGRDDFNLSKKALLIMCADNGIVKEGVSQSDSSVTLSVAKNMLRGKSSAAVMAKKNDIDVFVADVGIDSDEVLEGIIDKKVRRGSRNFLLEPAMTEEETLKAINIGINLVRECKEKNYDILLTGEMGIGNTTTSTAVASAILSKTELLESNTKTHRDYFEAINVDMLVDTITGRGAGLDDKKLEKKKSIIKEAIKKYSLKDADAFKILMTAGGYDIAALTGVCIGGAIYDIPIVLDGVITMAAALAAEKIVPGVKDYLTASHYGKEIASKLIAERLELKPVINADMALGEGTGAIMMISLLEDAIEVYKNAAVFSEISVDNYVRSDK